MQSRLFSPPARRVLLGAVATLILGAAAVGVAVAQQTSTTTPTGTSTTTQPNRPSYQQFIDALARRLGITSDRLTQAISDARTDVGLPAANRFPGGPEGRRGPGGRGERGFGGEFSVAAQAIGITTDQLRQELPGNSLAQVAQNHGKNPTDVANALKTDAQQRIDQAVTAGRLPADRANQLKQDVDQRIDQRLNQVVPQGGPGQRGPGGQGQPRP